MSRSHSETYARSSSDPAGFWLEAAAGIDWDTVPETAIDDSAAPIYRWYPDGMLNICHNALDRHVQAGRGDATALAYDSAMLGIRHSYSYAELLHEVATFAEVLAARGIARATGC